MTTAARNQGITILLNQAYNPIVVAARSIAGNVSGQIMTFSSNFNTGLYPPIVKAYAAGDKKDMFSLIFKGSKITFFLMWVLALPLFIELKEVLNIWLKNPPADALLFTRLTIVEVLITSVSLPLMTAARATGKVKIYELSLGSIQLLILLCSWILLSLGSPAYIVFVVAIVANIFMFISRLIIIRNLLEFPVSDYFRKTIIPAALVVIISAIPCFLLNHLLPESFIFTCIIIFSSIFFISLVMYFVGLTVPERKTIRTMLENKIGKSLTKARV